MISFNTVDSEAAWKTVQLLISWLCQKPADLDLHCFLNKLYIGSKGQGLISEPLPTSRLYICKHLFRPV